MEGIFLIGIIAILIIIFISMSKPIKLGNYKCVRLGMPEDEMLSIMGDHYNKSLLKNGRVKYEWRIRASSHSVYGVRFYSGVRKVSIYVKDGVVEEVRPYNV